MLSSRRLILFLIICLIVMGLQALPASADDLEFCGYVIYQVNGGPTSTVTAIPDCAPPCPEVSQGPGHVGVDEDPIEDTNVDWYVCVTGIP